MNYLMIIVALCLGAIVAWMPYGYVVLPLFALLPIIYLARWAFDKKYRDSGKSAAHFNFFLAFWAVIMFFHLKTGGLETMLPKMDVEQIEVGNLVEQWQKLSGAPKIECDPEIRDKQISIHTITPISFTEALALINEKTNAAYRYEQNQTGMSIAKGPEIRVEIIPSGKKLQIPSEQNKRGRKLKDIMAVE